MAASNKISELDQQIKMLDKDIQDKFKTLDELITLSDRQNTEFIKINNDILHIQKNILNLFKIINQNEDNNQTNETIKRLNNIKASLNELQQSNKSGVELNDEQDYILDNTINKEFNNTSFNQNDENLISDNIMKERVSENTPEIFSNIDNNNDINGDRLLTPQPYESSEKESIVDTQNKENLVFNNNKNVTQFEVFDETQNINTPLPDNGMAFYPMYTQQPEQPFEPPEWESRRIQNENYFINSDDESNSTLSMKGGSLCIDNNNTNKNINSLFHKQSFNPFRTQQTHKQPLYNTTFISGKQYLQKGIFLCFFFFL